MSESLWPTRLLCPWASPGKNTGAGCHALPPGDLSNPGNEPAPPAAPALQADSLPLSPREALSKPDESPDSAQTR